MCMFPQRRDGYYDERGYWRRSKLCFVYCGERCTCDPPFGLYYSEAHDTRKTQDPSTPPSGDAT